MTLCCNQESREPNDNEIINEAIINGVVDRLRPVLLTSLTTIGGLSALMFETSLQAQFLIPMAATIVLSWCNCFSCACNSSVYDGYK